MAIIVKKANQQNVAISEPIKPAFIPSVYQQRVYDFITSGNGNAVIDAVAGSGKSTTIVNALRLIPSDKSVLFLAFNKSIVDELKLKISNSKIDIQTLHSLGMQTIKDTLRFVNVDASKYKIYVKDSLKYGYIKPTVKLEEEEMGEYTQNINKLVDLIRVYLASDINLVYDIADKYQINIIDNEADVALNAVNWGISNTKSIDFTDMIFLPNVKNYRTKKYDFVFIDECQDLNTAQRELFLQCLNDNGRFIAVGDPRQAIYGFAGADVESFKILANLPNTINLPLSISYRCDSDIINLAKTIVPQIESRPNALAGTVDRNAHLIDIQDGDMILCRNTAPLVDLCMKFIADNTKAYVKGKDIGANLINIIKRTNKKLMKDVFERLNKELYKIGCKVCNKQKCDFKEAKSDSLYTSMKDKIEAIEVLSNSLETANEVIERIELIFKDEDRTGICLSTIHKAKGLESNNVYIICEELFFPKRAMKVAWQAEQEYNIVYVAYTRAKHKLGFVIDYVYKRD
jgi:superfamily I DNA/RNA helicase